MESLLECIHGEKCILKNKQQRKIIETNIRAHIRESVSYRHALYDRCRSAQKSHVSTSTNL